jgi:TIR domain
MATKVFLSWSGDLSRKLADALRSWLPSTLQSVKPYFTPEDIEKGAKWGSEISKELETSNIGIVCLTRDNTEKPWILFEAGALSKSIQKSHVCTLLFDLEPTDVKGPLTSFQATKFIKDDFKKLVMTINSSAGDLRLEPQVMESVFDMWWPKLEQQVADILKSHNTSAKTAKRSERDILEELLELTRLNSTRSERPTRISPRVVRDLMEGMEELQMFRTAENSAAISLIITRLGRPLRHLCLEAGMPEMYEKMRMLSSDLIPPAARRRVVFESSVETGKTTEG